MPSISELPEKFQSRLRLAPCPKPELGDCWLWNGRVRKASLGSGGGYGIVYWNGKTGYVHRLVFLMFKKIPKGKQLDHLCRVRHCANPRHLEPITQVGNIMRGEWFIAKNAAKTHCPKGHSLSDCRIRRKPGGRIQRECRVCDVERARSYKDLHREEINAKFRRRYHTDPEFRAIQIERAKKNREA